MVESKSPTEDEPVATDPHAVAAEKQRSNAPPSGPPATAGLLHLGAVLWSCKLLISRVASPSTPKQCAGIICQTDGVQAATGLSVTFATRQDGPCSCA